jgi:hypothetical protein
MIKGSSELKNLGMNSDDIVLLRDNVGEWMYKEIDESINHTDDAMVPLIPRSSFAPCQAGRAQL